jgi:hypothetical protein
MKGWVAALALGAAAAHAEVASEPDVDSKAFPTLAAMLGALRDGSDASRYCARTGGMFLEADGLLRQKRTEKDVVEGMVANAKGQMAPTEARRFREIAVSVTQMAAGFLSLRPETAAVAFAQTCLASVRAAPGVGDKAQLTERYRNALACDQRHSPGSLDAKECVAVAFRYR